MLMKFSKWISIGVVCLGLAACSGGGGSPGATSNAAPTAASADTPTSNPAATVADIAVTLSNNGLLRNTGSDAVDLTVLALNASNNVVSGAAVQVSVDSQGVFASADSATGADGRFTGSVTSPTNKTDRTINVRVQVGNIVRNLAIFVVGSQITVTPVPGAPLAGQPTSLNIRLVDANNSGISGQTLTVSGTAGFGGTVVTGPNGDAIFNGAAPATAGTYTVVVTGSGIRFENSLTVTSPSGGGIPPAVIPLGPGSLSINPTNVRNNITAVSDNRAVATFKVLNGSNQGVANVRVKFFILPPGLGAGERMSTGSSVVYTNSAGEVTSDYIPGTRSSPTDGVRIRACYGPTDADVAATDPSACATFADQSLTVVGQALNLSIFENNTLQGINNNLIYKKTLAIQIGDAAGNPVRDAVVSASVDITHFGKGPSWVSPYQTFGNVAPTISDTYTSTLNSTLVPTPTIISGTITTTVGRNVWCVNEDLNRNGTRDTGEDFDGDGKQEPRSSDVVITFPNGNRTNADGLLFVDVQWGQSVGGWLAYTVKATTNVAGSEGANSRAFVTDVLQADVPNGSFLTPPYGFGSCQQPN
jgi:hypothetical protein